MSMPVKCGDIHEVGLDSRADLSAKLREDVEAAIIHIRPKIDGCLCGDEAQEVADGGGGVAH